MGGEVVLVALLVSVAAGLEDNTAAYTELGPALPVTAELGGRASLPCSLSSSHAGDRPRLVLWFREEEPAKPIYTVDLRDRSFSDARHWSDDKVMEGRGFFQGDSSPGRLVVQAVRAEDQGLYRCRVDFRVQPTTISRVNLTVNTPPEKPVIMDIRGAEVRRRLGPYRLGQTLRVRCSVLGGQPSPAVIWVRENQVVDSSYQREAEGGGARVTNLLTLPGLSRGDLDSILTCQASNSNTSLPVSTSVKLDLTFPPEEVRILGAESPLSAGRPHTLECRAKGARPPPKLNWYLGQRQVNGLQTQLVTSSNGRETVSTISLTPSLEKGGKSLRCVAMVPGLGPEEARETSARLEVNFMASAKISLAEETVMQGQDVYMNCEVKANPPPYEVVWEKDGERVEQDVISGALVSNLTLLLRGADRRRAGLYTCTATNSEGSARSPARRLAVHFPPECAAGQPEEVRAALHRHAEVACRVVAEPATDLQFRWVFRSAREEVDIQRAQVRVEGLVSTVDYVPRTRLDYGSLLCWAESAVGAQAEPCRVELLPTIAPSPPHNCSLGHGRLSCLAGRDGGLAQTFHLEARDPEGTLLANLSSPEPAFSLAGLPPGLAFTVTASSPEGRSPGLSLGPEPALGTEGPAQALPSLNTQGLRVTPLLGALIGVGGALGLLTLVLLLVIMCRSKRSSSSSSSSYQGAELEKELQDPDLIADNRSGQHRMTENVYIVEPAPSACCPAYSTLQPRPRPPGPYSSLRRPDYSSLRRPQTLLPEEAVCLLLPPPASLSSGRGSSSDLDNSRSASSDPGEDHRLPTESAV